ncbi:MAG TPA: exodeoxyribonuclease VII large subunit [Bacillota bacterium]|nr:exodeoxyribonuclease VII large subunit [Bacillota bacterium]
MVLERLALTVTQLTRLIKDRLEAEPALQAVSVAGEVSNYKRHTSGHIYFTLKDAGATLRCVFFRSHAATLTFEPGSGQQVICRGDIGVFERDGQYQLYVHSMQPAGLGDLHAAFLRLKAKLQAEGLFDAAAKRPLPNLPMRVGLLTSPTGAALRDMVRVAHRRYPNLHLIVIPTLVQGPEAPADIVRKLRWAAAPDLRLDLCVLARGGGSIEELWAFNDEDVARAIRACPVPVVSAVGHETDFTIADFAADLRAPTPSAAMEMAVPERALLDRALAGYAERMERTLRARLRRERQRLQALAGRRVLSKPTAPLDAARERLDRAGERLLSHMRLRSERGRLGLGALGDRLQALSPYAVLARGYAIARAADGTVLRSAEETAPGAKVEVLLHKGRLLTRVEQADA